MIATKSEMLSRHLSQGWNRPISMTKRLRLKEDREMGGGMTASQRVHMRTYFCYVDVTILPKSRHMSTKKVIDSLSAPASPSTSLSNKHTTDFYKDIHDLNNVQQKSLLGFARSIFFFNMLTTVDLSLAFFVMFILAHQAVFLLFRLRKESAW